MNQEFTIQWYPGHMAKARRLLVSQMKQVDFVIEVADARAPATTRNPDIDDLIAERPRLLLLSKEDMAEPEALSLWVERFQAQGLDVVTASLLDQASINHANARIHRWIDQTKGSTRSPTGRLHNVPGLRLPQASSRRAVRRGLIVGIPNTGKSTLIRSMGGQGVRVGAKAGVTRSLQWINARADVQLLDSPGILWPRAESGRAALILAWLGSVGDGAYDHVDAALGLGAWLLCDRPSILSERYGLDVDGLESPTQILEGIAQERGLLARGGEPDVAQAAQALIWDLRRGRLGRITFDDPREM